MSKINVLIINEIGVIVDGFNDCIVGNDKSKAKIRKYLDLGYSTVGYEKQYRKSLKGKKYNMFM